MTATRPSAHLLKILQNPIEETISSTRRNLGPMVRALSSEWRKEESDE